MKNQLQEKEADTRECFSSCRMGELPVVESKTKRNKQIEMLPRKEKSENYFPIIPSWEKSVGMPR